MIAEQVFDNTLVAAGLMDDSRVMLPRYVVYTTAAIFEMMDIERESCLITEGHKPLATLFGMIYFPVLLPR